MKALHWHGQPCVIVRKDVNKDGTIDYIVQTVASGPHVTERIYVVPKLQFDKAQAKEG